MESVKNFKPQSGIHRISFSIYPSKSRMEMDCMGESERLGYEILLLSRGKVVHAWAMSVRKEQVESRT